MFEKSIQDLVRGLRKCGNASVSRDFIAKSLEEIQSELKSENMDTKSNAVSKLVYLNMLGYECPWAYFHVIQVMASSLLVQKKIGYHAASYLLADNTDALCLCTNLFKKDLMSVIVPEVGTCLGTISQIMTFELARDLHLQIIQLLSHSQATIRKKAIVALYQSIICYPDVLTFSCFTRLKLLLEDSDYYLYRNARFIEAVSSVAINAFYELARANPEKYIALSPTLYKILTTTTNNWIRIRIVNFLSILTPHEPRIIKKVAPILHSILNGTAALSITYEIIQSLFKGKMISDDNETLARICIDKLKLFLSNKDQNLRFVALCSLPFIPPTHQHLVSTMKSLIMSCVIDPDVSIRHKSICLLCDFSAPQNIIQIAEHICTVLNESTPTYLEKQWMITKIVEMCYSHKFAKITDFEWCARLFFSLLGHETVDTVGCTSSSNPCTLQYGFSELLLRVPSLKPFVFNLLMQSLQNEEGFFRDHVEVCSSILLLILDKNEYTLSEAKIPDFQERIFIIDKGLKCLQLLGNDSRKLHLILHLCFRLATSSNDNNDCDLVKYLSESLDELKFETSEVHFYRELMKQPTLLAHLKKPDNEFRPVASNAQDLIQLPSLNTLTLNANEKQEEEKVDERPRKKSDSGVPSRITLRPRTVNIAEFATSPISTHQSGSPFYITNDIDIDKIPIVRLNLNKHPTLKLEGGDEIMRDAVGRYNLNDGDGDIPETAKLLESSSEPDKKKKKKRRDDTKAIDYAESDKHM